MPFKPVRSHTILVSFPYTSASLAAPQALGTSPQDKNQEGVKASNSHSFVHALSSSSGSKLYTLLCSGFPLPIVGYTEAHSYSTWASTPTIG